MPSPSPPRLPLPTLVDLRTGERDVFARAFALLALTIGAHTVVETARDTLFLTRLPPERLAIVYVAVAFGTVLVSPLNARLVRAVGARNAIVATLVLEAFGIAWFRLQSPTTATVFGLYVFGGVAATTLVAQFWILASTLFTVAQGRRLFGPIAAGGVFGAVVGALASTLLLLVYTVRELLVFASGAFMLAAFVATLFDADDDTARDDVAMSRGGPRDALRSSGEEPFVGKLALIVALSTALSVVVDYIFKAQAVASLGEAQLGGFFARYHLVLNGLSLTLQLFLTGPLVARLGVLGVTLFTPTALLLSAGAALITGAPLAATVALRGLDGALRNSLQRVSLELLWAPIARPVKVAAKALVDGIVARAAQAGAALGLVALTTTGHASLPALTLIAAVLAGLWLAASVRVGKPYIELFRKALGRGDLDRELAVPELDLTAVQALLEALAHPEQSEVIAAMNVLAERGRSRLIPALILYHDEETVLERALALFADSERRDWFPLGERLLKHPSQNIRTAAVRALALAHAEEQLERAAHNRDPQVRARAALHLAQLQGQRLSQHPGIQSALAADGPDGEALKLALIEALGAHPGPEAPGMLLALAEEPRLRSAATAALGLAADATAIDFLVERLGAREDRAAARRGLVRIGKRAFDALIRRLDDPTTPRRILLHLPRTVAAFRNAEAVRVLSELLRSPNHHGLVRYKALRGIEDLALRTPLAIDQHPILAEIARNATEFLRLFTLALPLRSDPSTKARTSLSLVLGMLEDKLAQSRDRIQRLVQIAQRTDDVPRMFAALSSQDPHERARAAEYLDALARSWDGGGEGTARLLRFVVDEQTDAERARTAEALLGPAPETTDRVLAQLSEDPDPLLRALAVHALEAKAISRPSTDSPLQARPQEAE